tara:strand:- start:1528 stop:2910 length:1383 start_codon:yes stop_codon:yes gene_type:complete
LNAEVSGNPFEDVAHSARFVQGNRVVPVNGFYDGAETYRIRFMLDSIGTWQYETRSTCDTLNGMSGSFECIAPSVQHRGQVVVRGVHHFAYAEGTPYYPVGTTCYTWNHQGYEQEEKTLQTLRDSPFNKIRMCVFSKHYSYSRNEPDHRPFEGSLDAGWNFTRFNPAFWHHLEERIGDLRDLGIESDLILFHPYDRWGYAKMDEASDDRYLKYAVARLSAFRNVWWSLANEWDLMRAKSEQDWDRYFKIIQECDPSQHLRSIHNCARFYDHNLPWVTHANIQNSDTSLTTKWRNQYRKPVIDDEYCYEGNVPQDWGNITGQELVKRFWDGFIRGGYVGHGKTYLHPDDVLWWSKGGVLHGTSPARIAFLRKIIEAGPGPLEPKNIGVTCAGHMENYYLAYLGPNQSARKRLTLPEDHEYRIVDTWETEISTIGGTYTGKFDIDLPGKPFTALRITRKEEA